MGFLHKKKPDVAGQVAQQVAAANSQNAANLKTQQDFMAAQNDKKAAADAAAKQKEIQDRLAAEKALAERKAAQDLQNKDLAATAATIAGTQAQDITAVPTDTAPAAENNYRNLQIKPGAKDQLIKRQLQRKV